MVDYLLLNDSRKRGRSVSQDFKKYKFHEKENKLNSMNCGFKTDKILTAIKGTDRTVTTSEGKVIHKKLASKPLKFQTFKKTDEPKRTINRCRRCGKFSNGEYCETHQRLNTEDPNNNTEEAPGTSYTLPKMPMKKQPKYNRVVVYDSSSRDSDSVAPNADMNGSDTESDSEKTDLETAIGQRVEELRAETPTLTSPIGCSTEIVTSAAQPDQSGTPVRGQESDVAITEQEPTGKPGSKIKFEIDKNQI